MAAFVPALTATAALISSTLTSEAPKKEEQPNETGFTATAIAARKGASLAQKGVMSKAAHGHAILATIHVDKSVNGWEDKLRECVGVFGDVVDETTESFDASAKTLALVGVSPELWAVWDSEPPHELHAFESVLDINDEVVFERTQGELFILVKSERVDHAFDVYFAFMGVLEERGVGVVSVSLTQGFRYKGGKDLTGFIDGTRQPDHSVQALEDTAVINEEDKDGDKHAGGSYVYTGRFVHDLSKFNRMSTEEKTASIGRHYGVEKVVRGKVVNPEVANAPRTAHIHRGYGVIYRQAWPYATGDEKGLFLCAFSRFLEEIDDALNRMAGNTKAHKNFQGERDALLSYTTNVESGYYYVPSMAELAGLRP